MQSAPRYFPTPAIPYLLTGYLVVASAMFPAGCTAPSPPSSPPVAPVEAAADTPPPHHAAVAPAQPRGPGYDALADQNAARLFSEGRQIFRYDTFGDETFWGGALELHQAIKGAALGGVGPGVSPKTALSLGMKVDSEALPAELLAKLNQGAVDLEDPATTVELLRLNAILGVTGLFGEGSRALEGLGIQCAFCHSTVDNQVAPGIGRRLDGWANRDLDIGAIISVAPNLEPVARLLGVDVTTVKKVLAAWGPGKYDAHLFLDGKAFRPDGRTSAVLLPPAFGLAGSNQHTWTGAFGNVTYWNAFVANLQMMGKGTFFDPRLDNADKFPIAARNRLGHQRSSPDLITPKLSALHIYQLSLPVPPPPAGSFDPQAALRGEGVFNGAGTCSTCHVPPIFTEPGWNLHRPEEIGIDAFEAERSPDNRYRTAPLRGLWTHQKGGFYHDGRFATLDEVVAHYDQALHLKLHPDQQRDLVQYLLSL